MPTNKIVVNASPLIILCKCDLEDLLPQLFHDIVIPQGVYNEIAVGDDRASARVSSVPWLRVVNVDILEDVAVWNLGTGQALVEQAGE
jgi:predicted nucleic acid-binding protein